METKGIPSIRENNFNGYILLVNVHFLGTYNSWEGKGKSINWLKFKNKKIKIEQKAEISESWKKGPSQSLACQSYLFQCKQYNINKYGKNSSHHPSNFTSEGSHTHQNKHQYKDGGGVTKIRLFYMHCSATCFYHLNKYPRQFCKGDSLAMSSFHSSHQIAWIKTTALSPPHCGIWWVTQLC